VAWKIFLLSPEAYFEGVSPAGRFPEDEQKGQGARLWVRFKQLLDEYVGGGKVRRSIFEGSVT